MKKDKRKKEKKAYKLTSVTKVLVVMLIITAAFTALTYFELRRYEDGIIDVCATQQDSYVQLVIDQINLKENRTDEEIIENILSTLDSSSNRYWTFSREQTMLYVKDALETNRYQSLTANSYYTTESAQEFIDSLAVNKVKHERIELEGKDYIASGALFLYDGEEYRICLLTNTTVLLDNNKFLGSKMELIIIFIIIYSALFIMPIAAVIVNNRIKKTLNVKESELVTVNRSVEELNEKLTTDEIYDNRKNLFQMSAVRIFINEYKKTDRAFPITFIAYKYGEKETVSNFFGHNCVLLGDKDIKFYDGRLHLALIMSVQCDEFKALDLDRKMKGDFELLGMETVVSAEGLDAGFERILESMGNPEIAAASTGKAARPDSRTESRYRVKEDNKNAQ